MIRRALLLVVLSACASLPAAAQSTESGRITGVVKDNQGGVVPGATVSLDADVFNVLNANTTLAAQTNVASPNFQVISLNLSPRILRFGLRVMF